MVVACSHPLPLSACMLHFDLVSILFATSLQHFSENVFTLVSLVFTVCSNTYKPTDAISHISQYTRYGFRVLLVCV